MTQGPSDPTSSPEAPKIPADKTIEKGRPAPSEPSAFQEYKEKAPGAVGPEATSEISPMDLASKAGISTTPTFQTLIAQAQNTQDSLGEIQKNLNTQNLKFKKSQTDLLQTKLTNANDHLKSANQKLSANVPENTQIPEGADPVTRFLGLVTDGQNKLFQAQNQLQNLKTGTTALSPGDMLLVQIKLSQAQQEIEYSSILLSKVVDSLKQIISIQM